MAKISIIVLLCEKHTFINLAEISLFNIFIWITNKVGEAISQVKRDP
jgi:hypothetical protein